LEENNKMKKRYGILMVLVAILMVSGQSCESNESKGDGVFLGGKEGLFIDFLDDAPSLGGNYKGEEFPIDLELINKGETVIAQGAAHIYLTGALYGSAAVRTTLAGQQTTNDVLISAIEEGEGGVVEDSIVMPLGTASYEGEILGDSVPLDVRASVCYPYQTKVQIDNFCIPSTTRRTTGTQECDIDGTQNILESNANSGAPVYVSSIREKEGSDFVRVTLDINNVGSGEVVGAACARDIQRSNLNEVTVTMPTNFECTFKAGTSYRGIVELRGGHGVLRCKRAVNNPGNSFKESLGITLSYNYMQEVSKTITINKA
jgi:hypothetical protein|tara:strand:- start:18442 stop:19392 length:951 start_codon:yes stop_codon:yes gene_type:complete